MCGAGFTGKEGELHSDGGGILMHIPREEPVCEDIMQLNPQGDIREEFTEWSGVLHDLDL